MESFAATGWLLKKLSLKSEFQELPFDETVCLLLDAVDAGDNRTSSIDDSCLFFEREMLSRVNELSVDANNDLNLAQADLSFSYPTIQNLIPLDYFEIRDQPIN